MASGALQGISGALGEVRPNVGKRMSSDRSKPVKAKRRPRARPQARSPEGRTGGMRDSVCFRENIEDGPGHDKWVRLRTLEGLFAEGFITQAELKERRIQLIDELTGTYSQNNSSESTLESPSGSMISSAKDTKSPQLGLVRHKDCMPKLKPAPGMPNFQHIKSEAAIRHEFDYATRKWSHMPITVQIDVAPFARGALRMVYHMVECSKAKMSTKTRDESTGQEISYVAKIAIDPMEEDDVYLRDVEMQAHCQHYAEKFNMYNPPSRVQFVKAWVMELIERDGTPLCGVERFIEGDYHKHSNNFGWCDEDYDRNTPQAFSHYTCEASDREMVVVDIQGVGDLYTDPQIHTKGGEDFGLGNLGPTGINRFLETHKCNSVCRFLKLPQFNCKADCGTVPKAKYMDAEKIDPVKFDNRYCFPEAEGLKGRLKEGRLSRKFDGDKWNTSNTKITKEKERCIACTIL